MADPTLDALSVTYSQEADSCDEDSDGIQTLTVEMRDAGAGPYLVVSTTRWAADSPEALAALLRRVWEMAGGTDGE